MEHVRLVIKKPDGSTQRLIVDAEALKFVLGRPVLTIETGFQIFPHGTDIKVFKV